MADQPLQKHTWDTKLPLWSIVSMYLLLLVSFGSILFGVVNNVSSKEIDSFRKEYEKLAIEQRDLDRRVIVVETNLTNILKGIEEMNRKLDEIKRK
jgi:hypothetical protein